MRKNALVVEDDLRTQHALRVMLEAEGLRVDIAKDGDVAIEMLSRTRYSVILLDIVLPTVSGTAVMEHLRVTDPGSLERVVVVTGVDLGDIRALFPSVHQAFGKPVMPSRLREVVRRCVHDAEAAGDRRT